MVTAAPVLARRAAPRTTAEITLYPHRTSFNHKRRSFDDRLRNLVTRRFNEPREGRPRDVHPFCRLGVFEPLVIGKPYRLELVERKDHLLQPSPRNALRFELDENRRSFHPAAFSRTRHQ